MAKHSLSFFLLGFPGRWLSGKEPTCQCGRRSRCRFDPWVGKTPWRRKWQSTPVFLPGESHGRRGLVGYSPRGRKESDTTERLHLTSPKSILGFPGGSEVKASTSNAGDLGSIPGLGRSPGEGNGNPLQYSCLENPLDRGAW